MPSRRWARRPRHPRHQAAAPGRPHRLLLRRRQRRPQGRLARPGKLAGSTGRQQAPRLRLPAPGHDPDSYIRAHGKEEFDRLVAQAMPLSDFPAARTGPALRPDQLGRQGATDLRSQATAAQAADPAAPPATGQAPGRSQRLCPERGRAPVRTALLRPSRAAQGQAHRPVADPQPACASSCTSRQLAAPCPSTCCPTPLSAGADLLHQLVRPTRSHPATPPARTAPRPARREHDRKCRLGTSRPAV
jgi:hypothetical protein